MSGIDTGRVRYLPNNGNIVDLGLVCREFRHESEVPTVGSSNISCLTDLESSLWWSYRTCLVWKARGQRLVFKCLEGREFRRSEDLACVGSSDTSQTSLSYLVFKYAKGQEFRRESGVLTVGSFGIHREFGRLTMLL